MQFSGCAIFMCFNQLVLILFYCFVNHISVKEKYRRQGHGEALLSAAIEKCRARNVHRISLHVDPSRSAALNLYKKFGFQVDSLVERYYSSDRNAYRMYLDFELYQHMESGSSPFLSKILNIDEQCSLCQNIGQNLIRCLSQMKNRWLFFTSGLGLDSVMTK